MKVYILDDSHVIRGRLAAMLSDLPEVEIIGQAKDPLNGLCRIGELKPDAVILDARNRKWRGIDLLCNIRKSHPASVVMMLTNGKVSGMNGNPAGREADFVFDKFTELDKISNVFRQLASRPLSDFQSLNN